MAKYAFLSQEWQDEARKIREEYAGKTAPFPHQMKANLVITEVPHGEGNIDAHIDSSSGELKMETGHVDTPDLTITLDHDTAKAIFVEGNPQAGMQAFMAGKVKVQGDMTKLMAMQATPPDAVATEIQQRIKEITE